MGWLMWALTKVRLMDAAFKSILVHGSQGVDLHLSHPVLENKTGVTELVLQWEAPSYRSTVALPVGLEAWTGMPQSPLQQTAAEVTKRQKRDCPNSKAEINYLGWNHLGWNETKTKASGDSLTKGAVPPHNAPCSSSGSPHTWTEPQYGGFGNAAPGSTDPHR